MKRLVKISLAALLAAACCIGFAGCRVTDTTPPTVTAAPTQQTLPETKPDETVTVTEPTQPALDQILTSAVYAGLLNAKENPEPSRLDWYSHGEEVGNDRVIIVTTGIESVALYGADGSPVWGSGYTLYCGENAVGSFLPGEDGSNLYILTNGEYRVAWIRGTETARIQVYYDHGHSYGLSTRGVELSALKYEDKISILPWREEMTAPEGIRILGGADTAEKEFTKEEIQLRRPAELPVNTQWVDFGLINAKFPGYTEQENEDVKIVITPYKTKQMAIYTEKGDPVYACGEYLYYDDAQGSFHRTGEVSYYSAATYQYRLYNGTYYLSYFLNKSDTSEQGGTISIYYTANGTPAIYPSYRYLGYNDKVVIKAWEPGMGNEEGVTRVDNGAAVGCRIDNLDVYDGLINANNDPYAEGDFTKTGVFLVETYKIKSMGIYSADKDPIYADGRYLYYEDAKGKIHRVGWVELYETHNRYCLYDGNYYIGRIETVDDDAFLTYYRTNDSNLRLVTYKDLQPDDCFELIRGKYEGKRWKWTLNGDLSTDAVYAGLINGIENPRPVPVPPDAEPDPRTPEQNTLDRVVIRTRDVRSLGIYTSDGRSVYVSNGYLYYDDLQGNAHKVGMITGSLKEYQYHLYRGQYHIAHIDAAENSEIEIGYELGPNWGSFENAAVFEDLGKQDVISIARWNPGVTNESGIILERGSRS